MRQSRSVSVEAASREAPCPSQQTGRNIFFAIADSLHHSRRLAAHRILQEYRHLIDETERSTPREPNVTYGDISMPVDELPPRRRRPAQSRALPEMLLVGAVLIGFLLLHIVGAMMLERDAAADDALHERISSQRYD